MKVSTHTEVGGHAQNEDAFLVERHPCDSNKWMCFLADGQGGQRGGGPAARRACHAGLDVAISMPPSSLDKSATWVDVLYAADQAVKCDADAGFTTLVALSVAPGRIVGAASGDSAALLVVGDAPIWLTAGQRKNPPVGSGAAIAVPFAAKPTGSWKLVVMSDGVWKFARCECVEDAVRRERGDSLIGELLQLSRLPTGSLADDFTAIVIESEG